MAGLTVQNIGLTMPHGQAGSYARQPDMIINTRPAGENIVFGMPLVYNDNGEVVTMGAGASADDFVGVASREIKSSLSYLEQTVGTYFTGEPTSVFQRGSINVRCQKGAPKLGGDVYVRIVANESYPTAIVGGFEAEADSTAANTVKLTNCQWAGDADANGIAELRILVMNKA